MLRKPKTTPPSHWGLREDRQKARQSSALGRQQFLPTRGWGRGGTSKVAGKGMKHRPPPAQRSGECAHLHTHTAGLAEGRSGGEEAVPAGTQQEAGAGPCPAPYNCQSSLVRGLTDLSDLLVRPPDYREACWLQGDVTSPGSREVPGVQGPEGEHRGPGSPLSIPVSTGEEAARWREKLRVGSELRALCGPSARADTLHKRA